MFRPHVLWAYERLPSPGRNGEALLGQTWLLWHNPTPEGCVTALTAVNAATYSRASLISQKGCADDWPLQVDYWSDGWDSLKSFTGMLTCLYCLSNAWGNANLRRLFRVSSVPRLELLSWSRLRSMLLMQTLVNLREAVRYLS